ncbi:MAG TPA: DUF5117 domain-containing protein [Cytophagales bacterium]|jgi:hypothetical protein|nr:DUF5117 domain-containing protein [Cytophagales bacterium]
MQKILLIALLFIISTISIAQDKEDDKEDDKKDDKKKKEKTYSEIIDDSYKTDEGLFKVHSKKDKFLYEISPDLLGKEMLMVTRIAKTANGIGYGGQKINSQVLRWQKKHDKILLRIVSYENVASDTLPISKSVKNSNFEPVLYSFDIKTYNPSDSSVVIDVAPLFKTDVKALGFPQYRRKSLKITSLDKKRSFIESIKSFPVNIEARSVMTYNSSEPPSLRNSQTISLEINNSMLLLPENKMQPRLRDQRVGFFSQSQTDYGLDEHKAKSTTYIRRWKLVPKDIEAYNRGELVEPIKPIIYYIDPSTPKKWRKYLKQGVDDWQVAFEAAGFKNAIIGKYPPTEEEDPDWTPEDARYSVMRYYASDIQNAYGPHTADPRTGEILESDIGWYHNVMNLLRNWYMIQTAAVNETSRDVKFDDEVMGQLIRFVSAHEVGHTIGLQHNMGSSSAYPVDSLRSPFFTSSHGVAPSIMDYARFNYVAQPGDGVTNFYPMVGTYDIWAIKWGYTYFDGESTKSEQKLLNEWIKSHLGDYEYWFGYSNGIDPRSQTESIGDDNMMASFYGIQNLKRILPKLLEWSYEEGKNYDDLKELYLNVNSQFRRYIGHVSTNVGGVFEDLKSNEEEGSVYVHVPKAQQKAAITFLNSYVFGSLDWLVDNNILDKIENIGSVERIRSLQVYTLNRLFNYNRLARMIENEQVNKSLSYTVSEMIDDLNKTIWKDLYSSQSINLYNRNLQKGYVNILINLMNENQTQLSYYRRYGSNVKFDESDIRPIVLAELINLEKKTKSGIKQAKDSNTKNHLIYLNHLIKEITSKSI